MTLQYDYSFMITTFHKLFLRHDKKKSDEKGWQENGEKAMNLFSKSLCCVITEPSCQDAPVIVALKKIRN